MKKQAIKKVVILSDLHIGSTVGLWPPNFKSHEGFHVGQTPVQEWLWARWMETMEWIKGVVGNDPYTVIFSGDLVDGLHHKSLQVMTMDVADQVSAAIEVLKHVQKRAAKTYVVLGTEVHTRNDEYRIGAAIGAEIDPETGHSAFSELHLEVNGCYGTARHHLGASGNPYLEAGGIGRAMATEIMEAARTDQRVPKWMARAHRHRHGCITDGNTLMVVTGPWQALTRFGKKVVPAARCQPSCVILDWTGKEHGALPAVKELVHKPQDTKILVN